MKEEEAITLKSSAMLNDEFHREFIDFTIYGHTDGGMKRIVAELVRRGQEWERLQIRVSQLENENTDLRLQLQQAREHQWVVGVDKGKPGGEKTAKVTLINGVVTHIELDETALEPDNPYLKEIQNVTPDEFRRLHQNEYPVPSGELRYFFNTYSGPYRMADTQAERDFAWSRGPFASWNEANDEWKKFLKRQKENGQP